MSAVDWRGAMVPVVASTGDRKGSGGDCKGRGEGGGDVQFEFLRACVIMGRSRTHDSSGAPRNRTRISCPWSDQWHGGAKVVLAVTEARDSQQYAAYRQPRSLRSPVGSGDGAHGQHPHQGHRTEHEKVQYTHDRAIRRLKRRAHKLERSRHPESVQKRAKPVHLAHNRQAAHQQATHAPPHT